MTRRTLSALVIARPLLEELNRRPFSGRVSGVFRRACNLIDEQGRIIALLLPAVGQGPFAISIPGLPAIFESLSANQPAQATPEAVVIGPWQIDLTGAAVWEPRIDWPDRPLDPRFITNTLLPYIHWPNLTEDSPLVQRLAHQAQEAAATLIQAIHRRDRVEQLTQAVTQLAGLGGGLTPAGDDYLIGVIMALWLTGRQGVATQIAQTAIPRTNALSAAFLQAAARGEFIEPWHTLVKAWQAEDEQAFTAAVAWIAAYGASSGADALAGFANALLGPIQ